MKLIRNIVILALSASLLMAIPIELFKSKNGARFNNFGVTMKAKPTNIDCHYTLGYGKNARKSCKVLAKHQMKGQRDQDIYLVFDKFYEKKLQNFMRQGSYRFVSCTYTHKKRLMFDCSIK